VPQVDLIEGAIPQGTQDLGDQTVALRRGMSEKVRADKALGKRTFVTVGGGLLLAISVFYDPRGITAIRGGLVLSSSGWLSFSQAHSRRLGVKALDSFTRSSSA